VKGYVVFFEGDDGVGYSAYAPSLPGVVAAGDTREETERLIQEAITEHVALLRELRRPVPEQTEMAGVAIVGPAA
jgi:predicted RNase H-like HicB family nuclease